MRILSSLFKKLKADTKLNLQKISLGGNEMNTVPAKRWGCIIPIAAIMYMMAYMDRINVAMILPYVDKSFHLTSAASGFAAGIFFVGYMFLHLHSAPNVVDSR